MELARRFGPDHQWAILRDPQARGGRVVLVRRLTQLVDHGWPADELVDNLAGLGLVGVDSPVAVLLDRARKLPTTPPWHEAAALDDAREARARADMLAAAEAYGRSRRASDLTPAEVLDDLLAAFGHDPEALAAAKRGAQVSA